MVSMISYGQRAVVIAVIQELARATAVPVALRSIPVEEEAAVEVVLGRARLVEMAKTRFSSSVDLVERLATASSRMRAGPVAI